MHNDSDSLGWVIVWEYRVREPHRQEFENIYGPNGDWAKLFSRAAGYLGTRLLCDTDDQSRYVTLDRWQSEEDFQNFRKKFATEYAEMDKRCEQLTETEKLIGAFATPR